MRARGHSHNRALRGMADRWLQVLISMLRHITLYDAQKEGPLEADATRPLTGG